LEVLFHRDALAPVVERPHLFGQGILSRDLGFACRVGTPEDHSCFVVALAVDECGPVGRGEHPKKLSNLLWFLEVRDLLTGLQRRRQCNYLLWEGRNGCTEVVGHPCPAPYNPTESGYLVLIQGCAALRLSLVKRPPKLLDSVLRLPKGVFGLVEL